MQTREDSVKTLRLILGDQLNINHSWFKEADPNITYVLMEIRSETDYVWHHIQKIAAFFCAMYNVWQKMKPEDKAALLEQADYYLKHVNEL